MASDGNGRVTFLLRGQTNRKGDYYMGRTKLSVDMDFSSKVIFAYPQADGSLLVSIEEYDEETAPQSRKP